MQRPQNPVLKLRKRFLADSLFHRFFSQLLFYSCENVFDGIYIGGARGDFYKREALSGNFVMRKTCKGDD